MKLPFSFQFFSLKIKFKKNLSFYSFKIITNNISVKLSCSSYSDKYFVLSDNYGGDCYMYYDSDESEGRLCIKSRSDLWFCYDVHVHTNITLFHWKSLMLIFILKIRRFNFKFNYFKVN